VGSTTAIGVEAAVAEPAELVAITVERSVRPTSERPAVYVGCVAPAIAAHEPPVAEQRDHW
jgi:hypothetical protein